MLWSVPNLSQRRWKSRDLSRLALMKFTVLTTTSSTPLRSPQGCCEASATRCIKQWVQFALTATPCTNVRSPSKRPDIARAPSVHKKTQYFHSRLFSRKKKLFSIANNLCALQFVINKVYVTTQTSIFITDTGCCLI